MPVPPERSRLLPRSQPFRRWLVLRSSMLFAVILVAAGLAAGTAARGVAAITRGPFAYVSNAIDGTVSVIDTSSRSVVATITVGSTPFGVALNPAGTRAYVTNTGDSSVSVIDSNPNDGAAFNTVVNTILLPPFSNPTGITVSPSGAFLYIADQLDVGEVTVVNLQTTPALVSVVLTGGSQSTGAAVSPNGTRLYVTNSNSPNMAVFDTTTNPITFITLATVGNGANGVAVNKAGTRVYVVNSFDGTVDVRDANGAPLAPPVPAVAFGTGALAPVPYGVVVNAAGTRVYATDPFDSDVAVINATTNILIGPVSVASSCGCSSFPFGIAITPDGRFIYVVGNSGDEVFILDATTSPLPTLLPAAIPVGAAPIAFGTFIGPAFVIATASATSLGSSGSPSTQGQSVTFTATVSCSTPPTGTVTFSDGATTLATVALSGAGVATFSTAALVLGTHTITAVYAGDANCATSTSTPITQRVQAPPAPPAPPAGPTSTGATQTTTVGTNATFALGRFTDPNCSPGGTTYAVSINWGDGSTSAGSWSGDCAAGAFIAGPHTYGAVGTYSVTATVTGSDGVTFTIPSTIQVQPVPEPTPLPASDLLSALSDLLSIRFIITASTQGCGSVDLPGASAHLTGDSVFVTATPCAAFAFVGWRGGGPGCDGKTFNPCEITMPPGGTSIVAVFAPIH